MKQISSLELMPKPFDWIEIPAGKVTLGGNDGANGGYITKATTFDVAAFSIAKYPLTNAQFETFMKAGGYLHEKWWTRSGWYVRGLKGWVEPRYWNDEKWNKPDYPVVGVSWYEAIAFCLWLSETSGENISLPTDQQWQRAFLGDYHWTHHYGYRSENIRDCLNFNTKGTTPVTQYEGKCKGDNPFGVVDMIGNVWEWCLTKYESGDNNLDGTEARVLRGGSWYYYDSTSYDCTTRNWDLPRGGDDDDGFRIARN